MANTSINLTPIVQALMIGIVTRMLGSVALGMSRKPGELRQAAHQQLPLATRRTLALHYAHKYEGYYPLDDSIMGSSPPRLTRIGKPRRIHTDVPEPVRRAPAPPPPVRREPIREPIPVGQQLQWQYSQTEQRFLGVRRWYVAFDNDANLRLKALRLPSFLWEKRTMAERLPRAEARLKKAFELQAEEYIGPGLHSTRYGAFLADPKEHLWFHPRIPIIYGVVLHYGTVLEGTLGIVSTHAIVNELWIPYYWSWMGGVGLRTSRVHLEASIAPEHGPNVIPMAEALHRLGSYYDAPIVEPPPNFLSLAWDWVKRYYP